MKQDTYPLGINTTDTGGLLFSETYVTVAVMHQSIVSLRSDDGEILRRQTWSRVFGVRSPSQWREK